MTEADVRRIVEEVVAAERDKFIAAVESRIVPLVRREAEAAIERIRRLGGAVPVHPAVRTDGYEVMRSYEPRRM